jgi:acetoin utilization protein AcuB
MIVEKVMTKDVITLAETDTISRAISIIKEKKIRHIPIVDDHDQLIGLISDRDIRDATPSIFRINEFEDDLQKPVSTIMKTNLITGHPLDFVEEVGMVFCNAEIACLPIVQGKKLVGIITTKDLLKSYVQLTGDNQPGSQIEIKVSNKTGTLHDITGIFKRRNAHIQSVLIYPCTEDENEKILVFRVQTMNPFTVVDTLKKEGYTVLWPNLQGYLS